MSNTVQSGDGISSIIGAGLRVNGDVMSDGDLQIEGTIVGDVKSRVLNLGESGEVRGEVVADQLQVSGKIVGQIKARAVNLTRTARVQGDIFHETLSVEAGAHIEGAIKRITAKDLTKQTESAKVDNPAKESKPAASAPLDTTPVAQVASGA